jgi:hypothetical protein
VVAVAKDGKEDENENIGKPEKTIALTKLTKATTTIENKAIIQRHGEELEGSFESQTSYEPTVVGEVVNKLTVPPLPIMAFEGIPFKYGEPSQCPYCYTEQTVKNKIAWKYDADLFTPIACMWFLIRLISDQLINQPINRLLINQARLID